MKIAIVGSGNGAVTAALDMITKGHEVKLYCRNQSIHKFETAINNGGFHFNNEGEEQFVEFTNISDDMEYVLKDAEVIQIIIPSSFIEHYAKTMAEFLTNDQLILFNMAAAMGSIRFINVLEDMHIDTMPQFAEVNTLTYGTRVDFDNAEVNLSLNVRKVHFSTYDKSYLADSFKLVEDLYPYIVKEESLWKTNLENGNPEVHPGPTLLNVGRIDYADEFALYKEGITLHTVKLLHAVELERLTLGRKLGFELNTAKGARIERGYLSEEDEDMPLHRLFNSSEVFSQIKGPNEVKNRYLTEDIAFGLVLWSSLGRALDVETPNIDAIIVIASTILERDFFDEGLTVEELGLEKLGLD
ncbi:NAD/NADP-dependent octopine/nopaline dehydrogenase family protein [Staphylococcus kloosii]|jgi:opine dehydrogenase|uniref:6-phosphogluconate dehydrogenase, decarboxylating n=1 Tax=Staphylococcus kloosii TaxID=29384 RepID=A0A151A1J2_9STAP|nr:NAD/NADP-dependent octopine/nopaline dehydrogenase family protein [Staphylococcus kloosii]AVQ35468.1 octopine dehydrogenase [Staphylococcus kloosii]KYH13291.1 octopine dehydrogenase [Staphylococcus kloosii]MBF7024731.1 NAD/NADP octopine/nopaline dehydrogenase family protein [Staphylococcus kloosii]MCD8879941.1 NAD/NADP octopine/nopaline dehydrogenase family protein [Staphylococcus kloosii]PNZ04824.1 octopine dehydrogenase [Staphylococcus kloosii]